MLKQIFIWLCGIYVCITASLGIRDIVRKHNETFKVLSIHEVQTIVGPIYHIVASRQDGVILTFDRVDSHSLKVGNEFNVAAWFITVPKKSIK